MDAKYRNHYITLKGSNTGPLNLCTAKSTAPIVKGVDICVIKVSRKD